MCKYAGRATPHQAAHRWRTFNGARQDRVPLQYSRNTYSGADLRRCAARQSLGDIPDHRRKALLKAATSE